MTPPLQIHAMYFMNLQAKARLSGVSLRSLPLPLEEKLNEARSKLDNYFHTSATTTGADDSWYLHGCVVDFDDFSLQFTTYATHEMLIGGDDPDKLEVVRGAIQNIANQVTPRLIYKPTRTYRIQYSGGKVNVINFSSTASLERNIRSSIS